VKGLLEAAFATHLYPHIEARALSSNAGSLNVLRKAGFVMLREGIETIGTGAGQPTTYLTLEQPKWM
jgi:RimJ/RimL family protein N-acetyltransferase